MGFLSGWFTNNGEESSPTNGNRYQGKPLLILLENYVLDCIGCFPQEKVPTITSAVQRVYGGGDDWKATLRSVLHLDEALDDKLRQMWLRNQELANRSNENLAPEDFARMVVDTNLSVLID